METDRFVFLSTTFIILAILTESNIIMRRREIPTPTIFTAAQRTRRMSKTKYCLYDCPAKSYLHHLPTSSRRSWHIIIPKAVTLPNFCIRKCTSSQLTPRQRPQSLPFLPCTTSSLPTTDNDATIYLRGTKGLSESPAS